MTFVRYEFELLKGADEDYILQFVKDRQLSTVYHSHDFYEIMCVVKGWATEMLDGECVTCRVNSVVLMRPGDCHSFVSQSEDVVIVSLSVRRGEFEHFANAYDPLILRSIVGICKPICYDVRSQTMLKSITEAGQGVTKYDCKYILSAFLYELLENVKATELPSRMPMMLSYAISEIKRPENLKRGIEALSELSHYSQSHLTRLMREYLGVSPKQYINEARLDEAYNRIILTNESIQEISESVGFVSFSHFNKIFKGRFKMTPAVLRKSNAAWTT